MEHEDLVAVGAADSGRSLSKRCLDGRVVEAPASDRDPVDADGVCDIQIALAGDQELDGPLLLRAQVGELLVAIRICQ
jgi:hypothetical protein